MVFGVEVMICYVENFFWYLEIVKEDFKELWFKERFVVDEVVIFSFLVNGFISYG